MLPLDPNTIHRHREWCDGNARGRRDARLPVAEVSQRRNSGLVRHEFALCRIRSYNQRGWLPPVKLLVSNSVERVSTWRDRCCPRDREEGPRGSSFQRTSPFFPPRFIISAMMECRPGYLMLAQWRQRRVPCSAHKSPNSRVCASRRVASRSLAGVIWPCIAAPLAKYVINPRVKH